ncbi:MAG: SPFH domain-containing protein [Caldilineaceae bacterium]
MPRIIDVIEAPDQRANDLVVRIPETGAGDFRLGSQVIVRESQRAIFYRDGKSLDLFEPGRHTITTMNVPVLAGLLRLATGGKISSPPKCTLSICANLPTSSGYAAAH